MEVLWDLLTLKIEQWKPNWKYPYWNFIIAQNAAFENTQREVFVSMLANIDVELRNIEFK